MEKIYIATTLNGEKVYVDPKTSHAATHLEDTPELFDLVQETIPQLQVEGEEFAVQRDMGRIIGETDLVNVVEGDDVVYAQRKNRDNYTKFVRNRKPVLTSHLTIVLRKEIEDYNLWSAWIGNLGEPFPGSDAETPKSREYWATRALIWGRQEIIPGTETKNCPW